MRPEQIIDDQVDLYTRVRDHAVFRDALVKTLHSQSGSYESTQEVVRSIEGHLQAAYAYRVTEDMSALVQRSSDLLNEEDVVDGSLAPTGCGFVRFEDPLKLLDSRQQIMHVDWVSWGPCSVRQKGSGRMVPATFISLWNDLRKPDMVGKITLSLEQVDQIRRVAGDWAFIGGAIMIDGDSLGPSLVPLESDDIAELTEIYKDTHPDLAGELGPYTNVKRWIHALWLMLDQTITDPTEEYVRKTSLRRALFMGMPGRVTVIRLRRIVRPNAGDGNAMVHWSHRWYVRGHWRWQAYGAGRQERKRIWVNPFIKGPEDAPLIVTDKLYDLSR